MQLAKRLINEKNDVVLVDNNADTVGHLSNRLDCTVIHADGNNFATLQEAGIAKADALVCVTSSDEINMITCSLVETFYPDLLKIARVRNYAYYANAQGISGDERPLYGIDHMINPDIESARAIVNAVEHGAVMESLLFGDSGYEIVRITVEKDSRMDGQLLQDVRTLTEKKFIVAYVEHDYQALLPFGSTKICAGDRIGVLLNRADVKEIAQLCGSTVQEIKKIVLVGAGRIGSLVAERIIKQKRDKKFNLFKKIKAVTSSQTFVIVDSDDKNAKEASEEFPSANVYKADITDEGFIEEEGINSFDLAICTTGNYELNMVLSAYLESLGVRQSVALVASSSFGSIARKLGIDVIVPVRDTVVDSIMSHLRGKAITGIHTVSEGEIEVIECELPVTSQLCGKELKNIAVPGEFLVLLIKPAGAADYMIPRGDTVLTASSSIVLITVAKSNAKVLEKFGGVQ